MQTAVYFNTDTILICGRLLRLRYPSKLEGYAVFEENGIGGYLENNYKMIAEPISDELFSILNDYRRRGEYVDLIEIRELHAKLTIPFREKLEREHSEAMSLSQEIKEKRAKIAQSESLQDHPKRTSLDDWSE